MKYRINNQVVLSQIPLGPLAAHIGSFADFISAQGYALYSIHRQVRLAADFSQWLKLNGVSIQMLLTCFTMVSPRMRWCLHTKR